MSGGILLTQNSTLIIGQVAVLLGYLMEGIFYVIDKIGVPNVGLAIILFTIVIYTLMTPLTVKQQKFSKLSAKMNPELQEIQKKYKNRKDNDSMMAMNQETQAVYAKYGVSPTGSCLQLIIQMPILFALYRVIYSMPAYVGQIKDAFFPLVNNMIAQAGSSEFIQTFRNSNMFSKQFTNELFINGDTTYVQNTFIDCLNKASTTEWQSIVDKFPNLAADVSNTLGKLDQYNNFLGINIANSPSFIIKEAFTNGSVIMIIGALAIPVLAALTQWLNVKLMPQPAVATGENGQQDTMASSMKTMNMMMPLMSAFFCFTLPAGMGIYWVAGAVVRSFQQVLINRHIDKIDMSKIIAKNKEKYEKKMEKKGIYGTAINNYASMNTKKVSNSTNSMSQEEKDAAVKRAMEQNKNAKAGSIASRANLVRDYNQKNQK